MNNHQRTFANLQVNEIDEIDWTIRKAESLLSSVFEGRVMLGNNQLKEWKRYRSRVFLCDVVESPFQNPQRVIIKRIIGKPPANTISQEWKSRGRRFNPDDIDPENPSHLFFNEWIGTKFLNHLPTSLPLNGQIFCADESTLMVILEYISGAESLADILLSNDPARAETALAIYAKSLGQLHLATSGLDREFRALRSSVGGNLQDMCISIESSFRNAIKKLQKACYSLDINLPQEFETEVESVIRILKQPGSFLSFSPGDTCPDNNLLVGNHLYFIDFEYSGFKHALLDASVLLMPFPTCWCLNRLPDNLSTKLENIYRAEIRKGISEADDDSVYYNALLCALAWWTFGAVGSDIEVALKLDGQWGISSYRQRLLFHLTRFSTLAEKYNGLSSMGYLAYKLVCKLCNLWLLESDMPLYQVFKNNNEFS
jgi:thiamine kinase-like enzyme